MKSEIGSEFWEIPCGKDENAVFPSNTQWYLSGRTALTAILNIIQKERQAHTAALPSWCCESMIRPFLQAGLDVEFYPVTVNGQGLRQDLQGIQSDIVLVMDYFGYVRKVGGEKPSGLVLRDATHSLFCGQPVSGDYVFGSLRKWAGFQTGGYAWPVSGTLPVDAADERYIALRRCAMEKKSAYMAMRQEEKDFLPIYAEAEEYLDTLQGIHGGTEADRLSARTLDAVHLRTRRRENAAVLLDTVAPIALFPDLREEDCPLFVPILLPTELRNGLRRYLISQEIYCPIHWPVSDLHRLTPQTRQPYEMELSLVCDQRYTPRDMKREAKAIENYLKGEGVL